MPDLVTIDDAKSYLGDEASDNDEALELLLETVIEILEDRTGQKFLKGGDTVADEPHNGSGTSYLTLNRPASSVTSVKIGQDVSSPDDTLVVSDLVVDTESQRLIYLKGGTFTFGVRNVFVTYVAADNLPMIARAAVLEATAYLYHRRGKEHVTAESIGEFGTMNMLNAKLDFLPIWRKAVTKLRRWAFV
jgi:hypothetical protein